MADAKPIEPNAMIYAAKALRQGKKIPYVGEALFGDAERAADDIAYGFFPGKGSGMTTQLDPGVADLVGYGAGVPGAIKTGAGLVQKLMASKLRAGAAAPAAATTYLADAEAGFMKNIVEKAIGGATNPSRREAMKKLAGGAVAAATAGTGKVIDDLLTAIAKHGGDVALPAGKAVIRGGLDLMDPSNSHIRETAMHTMSRILENHGFEIRPDTFNNSKFEEAVSLMNDQFSKLPKSLQEEFKTIVEEGSEYPDTAWVDILSRSGVKELEDEAGHFSDVLMDSMDPSEWEGPVKEGSDILFKDWENRFSGGLDLDGWEEFVPDLEPGDSRIELYKKYLKSIGRSE